MFFADSMDIRCDLSFCHINLLSFDTIVSTDCTFSSDIEMIGLSLRLVLSIDAVFLKFSKYVKYGVWKIHRIAIHQILGIKDAPLICMYVSTSKLHL